nr:hypothetical protein Iba_chr07aCG4100 [Ipomoea batatas]GMD15955.1 hypothetical protein Iba_chr07cCG4710 [Ipomoea batatas]
MLKWNSLWFSPFCSNLQIFPQLGWRRWRRRRWFSRESRRVLIALSWRPSRRKIIMEPTCKISCAAPASFLSSSS